ncbi:MAG: hypothetical protein ACRETU_11910, partial [Steroidobacterales bacterium]
LFDRSLLCVDLRLEILFFFAQLTHPSFSQRRASCRSQSSAEFRDLAATDVVTGNTCLRFNQRDIVCQAN